MCIYLEMGRHSKQEQRKRLMVSRTDERRTGRHVCRCGAHVPDHTANVKCGGRGRGATRFQKLPHERYPTFKTVIIARIPSSCVTSHTATYCCRATVVNIFTQVKGGHTQNHRTHGEDKGAQKNLLLLFGGKVAAKTQS